MSPSRVKTQYRGHFFSFDESGWFNATDAAMRFGKRPVDWLKKKGTKEYIDALCESNQKTHDHFVKTIRGTESPGIWFHNDLAVMFTRWLSADFAIWCDNIPMCDLHPKLSLVKKGKK